MGFVTKITKNTMRDALIGHAKKLGVMPSNVRIKIYTDNEDELPKYQVCSKVNGETMNRDVEFEELIFDKINLFDKHLLAPPFIQEAFKRMAIDSKLIGKDCKATELMVIIGTKEDSSEYKPYMNLYRNNQKVNEITFDYFIDGNM